jgi:hypothetical protein
MDLLDDKYKVWRGQTPHKRQQKTRASFFASGASSCADSSGKLRFASWCLAC